MPSPASSAWDEMFRRFSRWCSIERVRPNQAEDICRFFSEAYADQPTAWAFRDHDRVVRRWRWLNEANPVSFDGEVPAWIGVRNGKIVGHFALLPVVAVIQGRPRLLCWGRDLIVAPEARHLGIGALLVMAALKAVPDALFVAGLNETAASLYQRLQFRDGGRLPLYLDILQPSALTDLLPRPRPVWRALVGAAQLFHRLTSRSEARRSAVPVVPLEAFDEGFDRWWITVEGRFGCVVRRASQTMTWRYRTHPEHHYYVGAAMDGSRMRGVVVLRQGVSRDRPAGFISELLADPDDEAAVSALLAHAQGYFRRTPSPPVFLRCTMLHPTFERALKRAGFFPVPSPIRWMLAHPQGPSGVNAIPGRCDWLLTAGDSDLDML